MKTIFACALLLIFFCPAHGQKQGQALIDSLRQVLKNEKEDTNKVNTLNFISGTFHNIGNNDTSVEYADNALALSTKLRFEKGKGFALLNTGMCYAFQGNYASALKNYQEGLSVFRKIGNKKGISNCTLFIGQLYLQQGNYPQSLKYLLKALAMYQKIGNKLRSAGCFTSIGNVYKGEGNTPKALEYYLKALDIFEEARDTDRIGRILSNIGNTYCDENNYSKALEYYFKALTIFQKIDDKEGIATILENIGVVYRDQKNYSKALVYGFKYLVINKQIGKIPSFGRALTFIGSIYAKQKKYAEAKIYLDSALLVLKKTGKMEELKDTYIELSVLDSMKGNYKKGWDDYKNYIAYRDSLINEATIKKTTQAEMNYEFGRKTDSTKAEQDKLAAIAAQESQRQKVIRNSFIGGFSITFMASGLFFYQRRKISREKRRSDELLLNILPSETAEELKQTGAAKARSYDMVTVLFTDFKNFTQASEKLNAEKLVEEIHHCYSEFDRIITRYGIEKIKTIGDSYMCAGGLPVENKTNPVDTVSAALEIQKFMHDLKVSKEKEGMNYFEIRIGIHTGPVVAGIVGIKKFAYDIWGDTVNIASRMESSGEAGRVNISESTYQLVKDKFRCEHRGKIDAKNKGMIDMYFVQGEVIL